MTDSIYLVSMGWPDQETLLIPHLLGARYYSQFCMVFHFHTEGDRTHVFTLKWKVFLKFRTVSKKKGKKKKRCIKYKGSNKKSVGPAILWNFCKKNLCWKLLTVHNNMTPWIFEFFVFFVLLIEFIKLPTWSCFSSSKNSRNLRNLTF